MGRKGGGRLKGNYERGREGEGIKNGRDHFSTFHTFMLFVF